MTPIQRIIRYPMLLKEVCTNFDKAEQAGFPSNITFTRKQTHQRDTLLEAYNKSQILAEYTDQMLIASRITGYSGKIAGNGLLLKSAEVECQKKKSKIFKSKNEFKTCQIFIFEKVILFAIVDSRTTDTQAPLEYWTHFKIHQKLKTRESCLEGRDGFEIDRNEEPQNLRSRRSQSSALNPESYTEFPEQMIIICENEQLRNELLQLINQRILEIRNIIDQMEMPSGVHRIHC